jgi:hypothetical protein
VHRLGPRFIESDSPALPDFPLGPHMVSLAPEVRWTNKDLDTLRTTGDEPADATIRLWEKQHGSGSAHALANVLMGFEHHKDVDSLINLLATEHPSTAAAIDPRLRWAECRCSDEELQSGQRLFEEHGLKVLMILVFYSLPAAYAAQNGVRVMNPKTGSTGFLVKNLNRRLIETAQFVIDVLTPAGLDIASAGSIADHGPAVQSALRVRLLHATIRSRIFGSTQKWPVEQFGVPVNQEDMSGTLLTFSWVVLDGLRKLHLDVESAKEVSFLGVWRKVGALLGVDLIPQNLDEAEKLMKSIKARQIDAPIREGIVNEQGREMTRLLLDFTRAALPFPLRLFRRLPATVMRFFLPPEVATSLGVPRTFLLDELVKLWFYIEARVTKFAFFDAVNRAVFAEWGTKDKRVASLFQFSRFFNKRLVRHIRCFDRNKPLEIGERRAHVDLRGMDKKWAFDQADFLTRGVRQIRRRVTRR